MHRALPALHLNGASLWIALFLRCWKSPEYLLSANVVSSPPIEVRLLASATLSVSSPGWINVKSPTRPWTLQLPPSTLCSSAFVTLALAFKFMVWSRLGWRLTSHDTGTCGSLLIRSIRAPNHSLSTTLEQRRSVTSIVSVVRHNGACVPSQRI